MWHVTPVTGHMTGDIRVRCTFSQNIHSLALTVWELEVTCDTWHATPNTLHLTCDIWYITYVTLHTGEWWTLCQKNVSLALTAWEWMYFKDIWTLDGVGPVDNWPSTDKLQHFVWKKKNVTCDMWHVTCDMWHVTRDTRHLTRDTLGGEHSLKISAP